METKSFLFFQSLSVVPSTAKETGGLDRPTKNMILSSKLLAFCERKSDYLVKKSKSLGLLFCFAYGHSFLKSNESK